MPRREFLNALFGPAPLEKEWIELRFITKPSEPGKRDGVCSSFFAKSVEQADEIVTREDQGDRHVYFGVATRRRARGTKADVGRALATWADLDDDKYGGSHAQAFAAIQRLVLPPSIIVDSGHGYHAYWLLDTPLGTTALESAALAVRRTIHSDAVGDSSRCMRMPGTFNVHSGRVPCTVVRERYDLSYSLRDLLAASNLDEKFCQQIVTASTKGYQSRSERDWAVIVALKRSGMTDEGIKVVFREQPVGDKYRSDGEAYLTHTIGRAGERVDDTDKQKPAPGALFGEVNDCYYAPDGRGNIQQVSTFTIDPKRLFVSDVGAPDTFIVDIHAGGRVWEDIIMQKPAFHQARDLRAALTSMYWQWLGSDRQVAYLLPHLVMKWEAKGYPMAIMTNSIGRHEDVWVYPSGVLSSDAELDSLSAPVVYAETGRTHPDVVYNTTIDQREYDALLASLAEDLLKINLPDVIWPILGWFFATPYKPLLHEKQIRFPALNLYGSRGSGKTSTMIKLFLPLFGYTEGYSNDCNTTHFVLMSLLSCTNAVPIYLTEFRRSTLTDNSFKSLRRMLLQAYDVGQDARGRGNQTTQVYKLSAPIIIDGEDALQDPAILQRTVMLDMDPETILKGTEAYNAFTRLEELPLQSFIGKYIQSTLQRDADEVAAEWHECFKEVGAGVPDGTPDRVTRNLAVCWFGMHQAVKYFDGALLMPDISVLQGPLGNVIDLVTGRAASNVDEFVTQLVTEIALGRAVRPFIYDFDTAEGVLWFHLTSAYSWWSRFRRTRGEGIMTSAALKGELRQHDMNIGDNPTYYVAMPKTRYSKSKSGPAHMYGLILERCNAAGLDIPDVTDMGVLSILFPR